MLQGSCLCGSIRYEIQGELGPSVYCHCVQCRKASGASVTTNAGVATGDFRFVKGEALVGEFESSPGFSAPSAAVAARPSTAVATATARTGSGSAC